MGKATYGTGTLFKRGRIWYVSYYVNGRQVQRSSRSNNIQDAKRLRDQILGQKARGEIRGFGQSEKINCNELLDDLLEYGKSNIKPSTAHIWGLVIKANIRPFFGHLKVVNLTTEKLKDYRRKRLAEGRSEGTCNRELSILRTALNRGRKCTPPKVITLPHFPMVAETNVRQGFLSDEQYERLRDALPDYLTPLFVTDYFTGVRRGELLAITWSQVDWEQDFITLNAEDTKSGYTRAIPILDGDMRTWLEWSRDHANGSPRVFHNDGEPIKDFRGAWSSACKSAGVPDLKFHDLRRTAVRNMRRAGVPQVVRMRITGHRTDSMERRYNIVDIEDIKSAKELLQRKTRHDEELKK
jgi:integrase